MTKTTISRTSKTPRLRRSLLPMSPQSAIRVRVAAAGQDGAAVPAAEESLVWGWQAVGSAESGCRGVVQWWGEGLVGERDPAYEGDRSLQPTLRDHVYGPERTELEVSGVEDEALPDLVGKFDAVEVQYPAGAWNAARSTSRPQKGGLREAAGAVEGVGRKKDLGANITKLFDGATGKKPGRIGESVVRLCE